MTLVLNCSAAVTGCKGHWLIVEKGFMSVHQLQIVTVEFTKK